jgi:recombination protein RecA
MRIDVRKIEQLKGAGSEFIGSRTRAKIVKNKVAPPFKSAEFDIMYNEGISLAGDLLDLGVEYDVIKKSGNSYAFGEVKLGVGRENAKNTLKEQVKLMKEIREKIVGAYQSKDNK